MRYQFPIFLKLLKREGLNEVEHFAMTTLARVIASVM